MPFPHFLILTLFLYYACSIVQQPLERGDVRPKPRRVNVMKDELTPLSKNRHTYDKRPLTCWGEFLENKTHTIARIFKWTGAFLHSVAKLSSIQNLLVSSSPLISHSDDVNGFGAKIIMIWIFDVLRCDSFGVSKRNVDVVSRLQPYIVLVLLRTTTTVIYCTVIDYLCYIFLYSNWLLVLYSII